MLTCVREHLKLVDHQPLHTDRVELYTDRICDGKEPMVEVTRRESLDKAIRDWCYSCTYHPQNAGDGDKRHAAQTKPTETIQGTRQGKTQGRDREDEKQIDGTESVISESRQCLLSRK